MTKAIDSKTGAEFEGRPVRRDNRREQYLEKPLPSSEESEQVILGGILLDNLLVVQAAAVLTPEMFYSPLNRRVFAAMLVLHKANKQIDPILIGEELKKEGSFESIGGITTVTNLTFGLPHFQSVAEYIEVVRKKWLARELIRLDNANTGELLAEEDEPDEVLARHITKLIHMRDKGAMVKSSSLAEVTDEVRIIFDAWKAGNENISSLKTGIPELDGYLKLRGLAKGELTLVGARPSTGKTALILQIATHIARMMIPVLFISLEMLKQKLVMRMLPAITNVANKAINPQTFQKEATAREAQQLMQALDTIKELPLYFDRSDQLPQLIATAEFFIQTKGVQLIVFDYLTLISAGIISRQQSTRDAEVGYVTNQMKDLAVRRNVAVLGAAQMKRDSEADSRPRMSGFRESGIIEQAVDVALFPYDPNAKANMKNPDQVKDSIWLDLYCDKQRDGSRNWSVPLYFDKNMQTLSSESMRGEQRPAKILSDEGGVIVREKRPEPEADEPDY